MDADVGSPRADREVLLVEYEKAQDSAEHHDDLAWSETSLNWVGSALLMGFVLSGVDGDPTWTHKVALLGVAVAGVALSLLVWRWVRQLRGLKLAKYERCREIEEVLGMEQHSSLRYRSGSQTREYTLLMLVFLAAWVILAVAVVFA